MVDRLELRCF